MSEGCVVTLTLVSFRSGCLSDLRQTSAPSQSSPANTQSHRVPISSTHRLSEGDHSVKRDDISVGELPHDGCLLQESAVLWCSSLQQLDSHLLLAPRELPHPLTDHSKLARSKMLLYPGTERERCVLPDSRPMPAFSKFGRPQ